jgi:hydrogenase nickel incorporation protein HypA/HybF
MHEMSIAQSLIDIIREEMQKHGVRKLRSVKVNIGKLSAIVPESLSFCFDIMIQGTDLEGAKLVMEVIPLEGRCRDCGKAFEVKDYVFLCPSCGGGKIETLKGQDLSIVEMEVE